MTNISMCNSEASKHLETEPVDFHTVKKEVLTGILFTTLTEHSSMTKLTKIWLPVRQDICFSVIIMSGRNVELSTVSIHIADWIRW